MEQLCIADANFCEVTIALLRAKPLNARWVLSRRGRLGRVVVLVPSTEVSPFTIRRRASLRGTCTRTEF